MLRATSRTPTRGREGTGSGITRTDWEYRFSTAGRRTTVSTLPTNVLLADSATTAGNWWASRWSISGPGWPSTSARCSSSRVRSAQA